jgi:hypothetical protein
MMSGGAASWFVQRLRARRHLAGSRVGHHRRPVIPCSSRMTSKREGYRPESTGADFPGQRSISASAAGHGLAGTGSVGARKRHPSPVQHVVAPRSETALHDAGGGTVVPVAHPPRLRLLGQGRIGRPRLGPRPQAPAVATTTTRPMARPSTTDHDGRSETPGR